MKIQSEPFDAFSRLVFPDAIAEQSRKRFAALAKSRVLDPARGKPLDASVSSLVFISSGAVKLVAHASAEREQVIAFYFSDDLFILPEDGKHSFSLQALQRSEVLIFPYEEFAALAQKDCAILRYLLDRSALSLHRSREKTIALGRKTALERTASFLLSMAERIGRPRGGSVEIELPMSRRDIADSLGLTIETISRQLSILRGDKVIETHGRAGVLIRSCGALEQRSGSLRDAA
ncbi:helix-turn-helix domain-containing protein [Aurantiacibacter sp. D1-12]|uniref:helix-turn-helix domain-containing protein n=1 Tax=Aurantiacibacter sp. D1-12 TaxID=2993658 RepID=UPI00237CE09A|nr:helix-turn-helix domain-containing protein [Aurantiacibacter sp. D1-12]MDE1467748.1 helix-turn-helix domain-containing protein [Aurantiacibacter sp. D1-12]